MEFAQVDDWIINLLGKLTPTQRMKLTKEWARDLRQSQQLRIDLQKNPDGSTYEARKPQKRDKKKRINRKKMFRKIRLARYMQTKSTADFVEINFGQSKAKYIAAVHHYGLREKLGKRKPVTYPQRQLLGITDADIAHLGDQLLEHLQQ